MNVGAFGENFPYSNFHDLNMDWIIKIAKDFLDQYTHIQEIISNGEQSLQDKADELTRLLQEWYDTHSEDIANQLVLALQELNTRLQTNITAFDAHADEKAQQTIASIPSDYTELFRNVVAVTSAVNNMLIPYNELLWVQGSIAVEAGGNLESTTRIRSGFFKKPYIRVEPNTGYSYAVFAYTYDNVDTYVGTWQTDSFDVIVDNMWHTDSLVLPAINTNDYYLRIVVRKTDNTAITPSEINSAISLYTDPYTAIDIDKYAENGTIDITSANSLRRGIFTGNGFYFINSGFEYTNDDLPGDFPKNVQFFIYTKPTIDVFVEQFVFANSDPRIWFRVINKNEGTVVRAWTPLNYVPTSFLNAFKNSLTPYNKALWVQGAIALEAGTNLDSATRIRSGFLTDTYIIVEPKPGYQYAIYAYEYDNVNTYVGAWQTDRFDVIVDNLWHTDTIILPAINTNNYYLRLVVRKTDNSNITPDEIDDAITIYSNSYTAVEIENYAKNETVDITSANSLRTGVFTENGFYFINSGFEYTNDDIPDDFPENVQFFIYTKPTIDVFVEQFIFANSDPRVWFRVINKSNGAVVRAWTRFNYEPLVSPANKFYILGDSISAGYYSLTDAEATAQGVEIVYRPEGLSGVGSAWDSSLGHNYWGYANKWFLHRTIANYAYPAEGFLHTGSNNLNGIAEIQTHSFTDAGLIVVAWGLNDWHYNLPRGDHSLINPSIKYPSAGYDVSQITTVNQAIWFCLGELIRKASHAKIVVQTPMNAWLYGGDFDSEWGLNHSLSQSGTLKDIHDDIVYWANYYGLEILDMTYNNSMVNRLNIKTSMIDGSHPTDQTHKQLARTIGKKLMYG